MRHKILIILTALIFACGYPQQTDLNQKYQIAQNFERIGDWENAVKIYEELYNFDSLNVVYLNALLRAYDQVKRYDDAVRIINSQLRLRSKDVGLFAQLGKMYARAGENLKAISAWEKAIDVNNRNVSSYYTVANSMIESRMIEPAIKIYEKGRSTFGDPYLFASDLGYLHSIFMNYTDATKEYLLLLKQNPAQLAFIQSRIAGYSGRTDGLNSALKVVENASKSEPDNISLLQLLAWLHMEGKNYDKAFNTYKLLDVKTKAQGREVYNFAERAARDKAYATSAAAYQYLFINHPKFPNIAASKFGYARILEESSTDVDTLKLFGDFRPFNIQTKSSPGFNPTFSEAVIAYNNVISEFPKTEFAARSLYRIAFINFNYLNNTDKALETLLDLENNYKHFISILIESSLLLGTVNTAKGNLEKAIDKFNWLKNYPSAALEYRDKAAFGIAEIDFFQYRFKESMGILATLTKNPLSDIANDAIMLNVLIQENLGNENALKAYSSAVLLKRQRQFDKAIETFNKLIKDFTNSEIIEHAFVSLGDIHTAIGSFNDAISIYEKLITDFPDNIAADKSQLKIAQVFHYGIKNSEKAISAYEKLLEKYPTSIYTTEARRRIRELRGDIL